jgi:hypothetical protein
MTWIVPCPLCQTNVYLLDEKELQLAYNCQQLMCMKCGFDVFVGAMYIFINKEELA